MSPCWTLASLVGMLLCGAALASDLRQNTYVALRATLDALENALDFYDSVHTKINLDAIIGTRIVEGQLGVLLKHLNMPGGFQVPETIAVRIQELQQKADTVSKLATPYVKTSEPDYYKSIGGILNQGFWNLDYGGRDINRARVILPISKGEVMHEDQSDNCVEEFLGSGANSNKPCDVTQRCWELMTRPGYRGYSLSHEVFYLQIGQQAGCLRGKEMPLIDELNAGFCANMYQEALEIAKMGFQVDKRDLFMEIPALCGMLGYRSFFKMEWLERILAWQWPSGCWGAPRGARSSKSAGERFKREEKTLPDGCQSHRTAVAVSALSQYIRYIIDFLSNTQEGASR